MAAAPQSPAVEAAVELLTREWIITVVLANAAVVALSVAVLAVVGRMINERRAPSNFFAWTLLLLAFPVGGLVLFFLLGGRKSRRLVAAKRRTLDRARAVSLACGGLPADTTGGNSVRVLGDGVTAWRGLVDEIARARRTIHVMSYVIGRDEVGLDLVRRLAARARDGVAVRLLVDAYGSFPAVKLGVLDPLRRAGGEAVDFLPLLPLHTPTSANLRNHRKVAVFDGTVALVGGQNLDGRFISPRPSRELFHDFSLRVEGPAAAGLERVFLADWAFAADRDPAEFDAAFAVRPSAAGDRRLGIVTGGPDSPEDTLWETILTLVQEARREILVVTPYFVPDEVLFRSLVVKAHAGRRVRVVVPSRSNHPLVDAARDHFLRLLAAAGVEILLFRPRMLHAKLIVVDDTQAFTGSANLDPRSLFVNFEVGLVHSSPDDVADLRRWAEELLPHCDRFEHTRRAGAGRVRRTLEDFSHLLVPLL